MEIADEHIGIMTKALEDYRRWFDDSSESDIEYREKIDAASRKIMRDFSQGGGI